MWGIMSSDSFDCIARFTFTISFCRLELEDVEMKHNSTIKQLMREFNTQQSLKETEVDSAVKEAIGETEKVLLRGCCEMCGMKSCSFILVKSQSTDVLACLSEIQSKYDLT